MIPALPVIARAIGIKGMIAIGMTIALAFVMWRADSLSDRLTEQTKQNGALELALKVSNASIAVLEAKHAAFIADGERRTKEAARRLSEARQANVALSKAADRIRAERALQPPPEPLQCPSPASVLEAEGL